MTESTRKNTNKLKMTILSLSLITVMSGAAVSPALGAISTYFAEASPILVKMIITIQSLLIILVSFAFGSISKYISTKKMTLIGLVLYIIGGCGPALVNSIYLILIFRVFLGIGVGLIMPLSTGLIGILFNPEDQSKLMGLSSAMNNLGGVIAISLSGILVSYSWRYSFLIYILGLIVLIFVVLFIPKISLKQDKTALAKADIYAILPFALGMFLVMLIFYALPSNFSVIASEKGIIPTAYIGVVMAVQNIVAFFTGVFLNRLIRCFHNSVKVIAVIFIGLGFLILAISDSVLASLVGMFAVGVGLGAIVPILNAQVPGLVGRDKSASGMSIMSAFLYLGQFLSPIILDGITKEIGIETIKAPYILASILSILLLILLIFLPIQINAKKG